MLELMRRAVLILAALALAACAPAYSTLYDTNHVRPAFHGPQGFAVDWSTGTTTNTARDYTDAQFNPDCPHSVFGGVNSFALRIRNGTADAGNGAFGGKVVGQTAPGITWDNYHYCPGLKAETDGVVFDRWNVSAVGDGAVSRTNGTDGTDARFSRSWFHDLHDDCLQDDGALDGVAFEDNFCDIVWTGISTRHDANKGDASGTVLDLYNNIISVGDMTAGYKPESYGTPNHGGWLKSYSPSSQGAKLALRHNTFVALDYPINALVPESDPSHWNGVGDLTESADLALQFDQASTPTVNEVCDSNTLLFLGPPSEVSHFLADAATWTARGCTNTTVLTGNAAATAYLTAVIGWHQSHDPLLQP